MEPTSILIPLSKQSLKNLEGSLWSTIYLSSRRLKQLEADIRTQTWDWKIRQNPLDSQPQLILCLPSLVQKNSRISTRLWSSSLRIGIPILVLIVGLCLGWTAAKCDCMTSSSLNKTFSMVQSWIAPSSVKKTMNVPYQNQSSTNQPSRGSNDSLLLQQNNH